MNKNEYANNKNVRALRQKLGLTQKEFWSRIFVTQSGGCRYETVRNIPKTVQFLIALSYAEEYEARALFAKLRGAEEKSK